MNAADRAAQRFLTELQNANSPLYAIIMANNMGIVGADQIPTAEPSIWSQIGDAFGTLARGAIDYGLSSQQAKQQTKLAEERAKALLAEETAMVALARQRQQTAAQQMELQREQASLTQAFQDLELSKWKQPMLWGGLALGAILLIGMANR